MSGTDTLINFLTGRGADLVIDFMADVGGDPEEYGIEPDELGRVTDLQIGSALEIFMGRAVGGGLVDDPDVVDAVRTGDVDWHSVAASSLSDDDEL